MPTVIGGTPWCVDGSESQQEEARHNHHRFTRSRLQEAKAAQCIESDHSIKRTETCLGLNSTVPNRGSIKEEGEDGGSNIRYIMRVGIPRGYLHHAGSIIVEPRPFERPRQCALAN